MRQDKFLLGILVFIGLLVAAALAVYVFGGAAPDYVDEDGPEAIVHNYTLAVTRGDYERAYSYLASGDEKPSVVAFRTFFTHVDPLQNAGLRIEGADILGEEAVVEVTIVHGPTGPFDPGFDRPDTAVLRLEEGEWKLVSMPWPFWEFDWIAAPSTPRP